MKCNQCGDTIPSGIKYCPSCGTPATPETTNTQDKSNLEGNGNKGTAGNWQNGSNIENAAPAAAGTDSAAILNQPVKMPNYALPWLISASPLILLAFCVFANYVDDFVSRAVGKLLGPILYGIMYGDYFMLRKRDINLSKVYLPLIFLFNMFIAPFYLYSRGRATGSQDFLRIWAIAFGLAFVLFVVFVLFF